MSLLVLLLVSFNVAIGDSTGDGGGVVEVRHFGSEAVMVMPFLISVCSDILNESFCYFVWNVIIFTGIIILVNVLWIMDRFVRA